MFSIRYASKKDKDYWFSLEEHLSIEEFDLKVRDKRCYLICDNDEPIGIMRYNLFWDNIPFLTMIHLSKPYHRKGFGRKAVHHWEKEMKELCYKVVMTSTQIDEEAQYFYQKLGYTESGSLDLNGTPLMQPLELFFIKNI